MTFREWLNKHQESIVSLYLDFKAETHDQDIGLVEFAEGLYRETTHYQVRT